jgi:hypothetical protein
VHGLIFVSLRDYVASIAGSTVREELLAGEPVYLLGEAYPDERFDALVERACRLTGRTREALLDDFGAFTAERTFARLYPALFDLAGSTRAFLLTVERPIHEVVRVAIPNATPPALEVAEIGEQRLSIVYTSARRLCAMLRGLVLGTARYYGETVRIDERSCMHRGHESCRFEVGFGYGAARSMIDDPADVPARAY